MADKEIKSESEDTIVGEAKLKKVNGDRYGQSSLRAIVLMHKGEPYKRCVNPKTGYLNRNIFLPDNLPPTPMPQSCQRMELSYWIQSSR